MNSTKRIIDENYNATEKEELQYVMVSIKNDVTKILLLAIPFTLLGYLSEYLYATLILFVLRLFTGGFHFNSYYKCLVFSAFSYAIILLAWFYLKAYSTYLLLLAIPFAIILVWISPTLTAEKRQAFNYDQYNKKKPAILIASLLLLQLLTSNSIFVIGSISIIMISIQNTIMKGVQHYEKNH